MALVSLFFMKGSLNFSAAPDSVRGVSAITDLRNQVYGKLVQQPVGFFHDNPVGRVMSAVISDMEQFARCSPIIWWISSGRFFHWSRLSVCCWWWTGEWRSVRWC